MSRVSARLFWIVLVRYLSAVLLMGAVLFLPAGTLRYWNAWVFLAALFLPMLGAFFFLFRNDPALLEKRMKTKEREKEQRVFVLISGLTLIAGFLLPGFDERFSWSSVPLWLVIPATAVMVGGYLLFMTVMKQNSYASRVVEVQEEQRVITTGVYSVVRHPMYLAATLIFVSAPLVLDSFWALIPLGLFSFLFVFRIKNEEEVLKKGLPGYEDYMRRVRYRLIPYIW